ncbi:MAG: exodeoxyribonuclease V subunit alpha [Sporichthyaceae bacterium]
MTGEWGPELALRAPTLLRAFNEAGVINAADVHVATTLGRLVGEPDETVLLAAALTVRSTRMGSVVLDLMQAQATTAAETIGDSLETAAPDLPWPDSLGWVAACAASPLFGTADDADPRPLRLVEGNLWLDRYFRQERSVADDLLARLDGPPPTLDEQRLAAGLARLFSPEDADQRSAAEAAARSRFVVVAGGPGTGKTTTVARLLALICDQGGPAPRIALAAPTGKAAARLTEAVHGAVASLGEQDRARVGSPVATTLHRLLGSRPGSSRFRHDRNNRLPHDVVVVDETSMVSLTLMARLLEAVRPSARLVLVGDPDQLSSVEAGAVLGDLTGESAGGREQPPATSRMQGAVVRLTRPRRYDERGTIAALAAAVRENRVDAVLEAVRNNAPSVQFVEIPDDLAWVPESMLAALAEDIQTTGASVLRAALAGEAEVALKAVDEHRLLCAHRAGPRGVRHWSDRVLLWLAEKGVRPAAGAGQSRPIGEPLLVTANAADLGLFNGDTGVVVADPESDRPVVAFRTSEGLRRLPLGRLPDVRPVYAMTVHKAQGSEFARVTVILPPAASPLATRQTLYTALTRATDEVRLIGSAEALERAVSHPAARASGLAARLHAAL